MDELIKAIGEKVSEAYDDIELTQSAGGSSDEVSEAMGYAEGASDIESMLLKYQKETS